MDKNKKQLTTIMAAHGYTVTDGGDSPSLPGIHVECRRVDRLNIPAAVRQACRDAGKRCDGIPVVIHRRAYSPWMVTMTLSDWFKIYQQWELFGSE